MVSSLARLAALTAIVAPILGAPTPAPQHIKIRNPMAADVVPDSWIVVYNDDINATTIASHVASVSSMLSRRDETGIGATWDMEQ